MLNTEFSLHFYGFLTLTFLLIQAQISSHSRISFVQNHKRCCVYRPENKVRGRKDIHQPTVSISGKSQEGTFFLCF